MRNYVLDSYALLTYLQNEAGADEVKGLLKEAAAGTLCLYASAVNLCEVAYITRRKAGEEMQRQLVTALEALPLTIMDVNKEQALAAAEIKAGHGISMADCFALALARQVEGVVVTTPGKLTGCSEVSMNSWVRSGRAPFVARGVGIEWHSEGDQCRGSSA